MPTQVAVTEHSTCATTSPSGGVTDEGCAQASQNCTDGDSSTEKTTVSKRKTIKERFQHASNMVKKQQAERSIAYAIIMASRSSLSTSTLWSSQGNQPFSQQNEDDVWEDSTGHCGSIHNGTVITGDAGNQRVIPGREDTETKEDDRGQFTRETDHTVHEAVETEECQDAQTEEASDVEGKFSAQQSSLPPSKPTKFIHQKHTSQDQDTSYQDAKSNEASDKGKASPQQSSLPQPKLTKPGRSKRYRENQCTRNSKKKKGGSRSVLNKTASTTCGPNNRRCLIDSVMALLPPKMDKESLHSALVSSMPTTGDTSPLDISAALAHHRMNLISVSGAYHIKEGAPYHLLQETECQLIINIKLTNQNHQTMSHFVGWDGITIHDTPFSHIVNTSTDRADPAGSNMVFKKMYTKEGFRSWQITKIYRLVNIGESPEEGGGGL